MTDSELGYAAAGAFVGVVVSLLVGCNVSASYGKDMARKWHCNLARL